MAPSTNTWNGTIDTPSWRLQKLKTVETAPKSVMGGSGNFVFWTNVPKMPRDDPVIADQLRFGRRPLHGPYSSPANEPFPDAGKRQVGPQHSVAGPEGKRGFPGIVGARSTRETTDQPSGLKRVASRARRDEPATSNPNSMVKDGTFKPESVKMFEGRNTVDYKAWVPTTLGKAEYGDWNWNQQLGFRRVKMMENGEPQRTLSHPVAFPGYKGYPPDRAAATNTRIDYALKAHGGTFTIKTQHPDVISSRANRAAASSQLHSNKASPLYQGKGIY